MQPLSDLSYIDVKNASNPANLLHEWVEEARSCGKPPFVMTLATATKNGEVSSRSVVIREITPDGYLTFTTQTHSEKKRNITENPNVAATILMNYDNNNTNVVRQINFVGMAQTLPHEKCKAYFDTHKLPAKIRSWIAQEGTAVDWNELKVRHDEVLKEVVEDGKVLEMPDSVVGYKIVPRKVDFYYCLPDKIGDRVVFQRDETGRWKYERVMP
ncbi:hypothetical protein Zmor_024997 [Zophobas morio]|uniref:pyridoxal 5'-phosphate synthase n=2 Tax=Zophobas morio TaxID=2755281 RepID=A0AA38HSH4_9CUCU|nr:hypothetical protein Zmor_024997 [Zophobas morio]